jgi:hypothetical protein
MDLGNETNQPLMKAFDSAMAQNYWVETEWKLGGNWDSDQQLPEDRTF